MRLADVEDLVEKEFLKCPSCSGKNIVVEKSKISCLECGEKEEVDKYE